MTVEERMRMIDAKVVDDEAKEREKERALQQRREDAEAKIKELKPRIDDLIKLANYAKDNGISLSGRQAWGGHEGYDTGLFYSNGWSHIVGFISDNNKINYLGIVAGGACGNIDFYTDGVSIFGLEEGTKIVTAPKLGHMERFVKGFDEFESSFYAFIDKQCGKGGN